MVRISPLSDFFGAVALRGMALLGVSDTSRILSAQEILELCSRLLSSRGDASGLALSYRILASFEQLGDRDKLAFFKLVASEFAVDLTAARAAAAGFLAEQDTTHLEKIALAANPQYWDLINRLNQVPTATMQIVEMRADLLKHLKDNPDLRPLDQAFIKVFSSWFNRGFLGLQNIEWSTSAVILEKIIKYEAVHGISGWDDLANRIRPEDRMIYGFFHQNLEDEPLIFVEVALTNAIPSAIEEILADDRLTVDAQFATTAVFYSISNCQDGLRGVPLGNFLIKQVVEDLKARFPHLKDFVTLSPLVRFGGWMRDNAENLPDLPKSLAEIHSGLNQSSPAQKEMLKAAARFLTGGKSSDGKPIDPVCRFHIGNGARLERLNWGSHLSASGFENAYTIMANYRYIVDDIEKNHEAFVNDGVVTTSPAVKKLLSPVKSRKPDEGP